MMTGITEIHRYVVDGDDAKMLYEIFQKSSFAENNCWMQPFKDCSVQAQFSYADGVFRVEEKTTSPLSYMAEILYFFANRDNIFSMSETICDGVVQSYFVDDIDGKYFVRPPKTEWELQEEEKRNQKSDDDLPF